MAETVLEEADAYTAKWDPELEIPIFKWEGFVAGDEFRENARRWEEIMADRGVERYIVDTREIDAHDDADKQWLAETWVPALVDIGIRRGAGVYGESTLASMEMEQVEEELSAIHPEYEFRVFPTAEEAKDWLASQ
ncbi:hypothetical protein [Halobellus clavatus]|jgi:hypothetical protein|uniref:SpoIIAA-like n=1 Tax=Halobellus clavatus TaxID=660517 RepID=A0A1H3IIE8_9EURY|nr:hypothetical protein [Halobellus clavatus]SDY27442.1 hypothetical protein SAMN04487946_11016 [Halobellus clavatus]